MCCAPRRVWPRVDRRSIAIMPMAADVKNPMAGYRASSIIWAGVAISIYVVDAQISTGKATGDQHQITVVAKGDKRVGSAIGRAPEFEHGQQFFISDETLVPRGNMSFVRTGSHEFGHAAGLRHPNDTTTQNLMTQTRFTDSRQVEVEQLESIAKNPVFKQK